ncbi:MAG: hypothetical protein M1827_004884 [Pycnora praestabilis]|nr:MAG: hypothetical protein M1827_004884 [Pycnora praestabilis]
MHFVFCLVAVLASITFVAGEIPGYSFGVPNQDTTFDYVVVGGGTAGLTIAARLAEDTLNTVAVVEAGGFYEIDNGNLSIIPGDAFIGVNTDPNDVPSKIDWGFVTTPQVGFGDRRLYYTRGKTLGGSSARNYMGYHRTTVGAFQKWAETVGDDSYTFDKVLSYYQQSANFTPPNYSKRFTNTTLNYNSSAFNNTLQGPLQVSYPNWASPLATWVQKGLAAIGVQPNDGFNDGSLFGSMWVTATIDPKLETRSSSQTAFLSQVIQNSSFQVYIRTLAKSILFNKQRRATGVVVTTNSSAYTLHARKEVILSAGAFQSPQLLMVSGIGPSDTLKQYNISVVSDLPGVGQNMWDNVIVGPSYRVNVVTDSQLSQNPPYAAQVTAEYVNNQSGPLTYPAGYAGYEKLPYRSTFTNATNASLAQFPSDWPEVGFLPVDTYTGYDDQPSTSMLHDGFNYGTIVAVLVAPLSRGNVTIISADTSDLPIINPNWMTDPADVQVGVAGFKRARQIFQNLGNITIGPEKLPGPTVQTDDEILAFLQQSASQLYHASATCAMGKAGDVNAVVDSRGRVFGVEALRVVDASAFPFLPPGLPQSTVYMLAEKIADDIKTQR